MNDISELHKTIEKQSKIIDRLRFAIRELKNKFMSDILRLEKRSVDLQRSNDEMRGKLMELKEGFEIYLKSDEYKKINDYKNS